MNIRFGKPIGVKEVVAQIKVITQKAARNGLIAFADYVYGDTSHGLRKYPSYRHITRASAYGQTFQSDKQRKWFWANGGPDMIGNNRTNETFNAWTFRVENNGYRIVLGNASTGAYYTMHDSGQAAQPRLVGWNKAMDVVKSQVGRALQMAIKAINNSM